VLAIVYYKFCLENFSFYDDCFTLHDLLIQAYPQLHNWSFNNIKHWVILCKYSVIILNNQSFYVNTKPFYVNTMLFYVKTQSFYANTHPFNLNTQLDIPRSEKEGTKPPYVCLGCSNHTYSNNMITRFHVQ
jgi:hypothetical protein